MGLAPEGDRLNKESLPQPILKSVGDAASESKDDWYVTAPQGYRCLVITTGTYGVRIRLMKEDTPRIRLIKEDTSNAKG